MCLFLSQLHESGTGNYGDVWLLRGWHRDTPNHDGIAMHAIMMEAEFRVKYEGVSGKANVDIMLVKLREAQNNEVVTELGYEHGYILLMTINGYP